MPRKSSAHTPNDTHYVTWEGHLTMRDEQETSRFLFLVCWNFVHWHVFGLGHLELTSTTSNVPALAYQLGPVQ